MADQKIKYLSAFSCKPEEKEEAKKIMENITGLLEAANIQMSISGCTCCENPYVTLVQEDGSLVEIGGCFIDTIKGGDDETTDS